MSTEPVDTALVSRERVEAYEKALGCSGTNLNIEGNFIGMFCWPHDRQLTRLGCPVAVAAARVEAAEVDRLTATLESARNLCSRRCIPVTLGRGQDEH